MIKIDKIVKFEPRLVNIEPKDLIIERNKYSGIYYISKGKNNITIRQNEDILLYLTYKFGFIPQNNLKMWLKMNQDSHYDVNKYISELLNFNLISGPDENDSNIVKCYYPTTFLESLFKEEYRDNKLHKKFPQAKLEEVILKQSVMYDIFTGNVDYVSEILGFNNRSGRLLKNDWGELYGNEVIQYEYIGSTHWFSIGKRKEELYKNKRLYNNLAKGNIHKIGADSAKLGIELKDYKYFAIITKDKYKYNSIVPDLVIPNLRKIENGVVMGNSIAIHLELTTKQPQSYKTLLDAYTSPENDCYSTIIFYIKGNSILNILNSLIRESPDKYRNINIYVKEIE